jgi:HD superfamily phosphodiesterase
MRNLLDEPEVAPPDSALSRAITEFVRDTASELLFTHSMRVFYWASLTGRRRALQFDPELLHAAALFHDLGLTPAYHSSDLRFEVDGANAARDFLKSHGVPEADVERTWLAIALHTSPGIAEHLHPEIALIHSATALDVVGRGFDALPEEELEAVLARYPREPGFKERIIDIFYEALKNRPETTIGSLNDDYLACRDPRFQRTDVCTLIRNSPWRD